MYNTIYLHWKLFWTILSADWLEALEISKLCHDAKCFYCNLFINIIHHTVQLKKESKTTKEYKVGNSKKVLMQETTWGIPPAVYPSLARGVPQSWLGGGLSLGYPPDMEPETGVPSCEGTWDQRLKHTPLEGTWDQIVGYPQSGIPLERIWHHNLGKGLGTWLGYPSPQWWNDWKHYLAPSFGCVW